MTSRALVVERRSLGRRPDARPDPLTEIRDAVSSLQDVPRESTASLPDMLFHNRRVAKKISAALERLEVVEAAPRSLPVRGRVVTIPRREHLRMITSGKGRAVRVVRKMLGQLEMRL